MKKAELVFHGNRMEEMLGKMQDTWIFDLENNDPEKNTEFQALITDRRRALADMERVWRKLENIEKTKTVKSRQLHDKKPDLIFNELSEIEARIKSLQGELVKMKNEAERFAPWGDFNHEITARLESSGVGIRFFSTPRELFDKTKMQKLHYRIITENPEKLYFLINLWRYSGFLIAFLVA